MKSRFPDWGAAFFCVDISSVFLVQSGVTPNFNKETKFLPSLLYQTIKVSCIAPRIGKLKVLFLASEDLEGFRKPSRSNI